MTDVVEFAIAFIKGLYYRDLLPEAEPEVDRRNFYLARDVRVLPPVNKLGGYHSRFIAWFDRLNDLVHFPSSIEFTKPGDKNAKPLYLSVTEARERLGVTGSSSAEVLLRAFEKLDYAVQASLAYTRASRTDVFSGEAYALERIMLELEPRGSKDLSGVKDAVLRALDGLSPYVETPIVIFSGHKSYYVVLELSRPIRAGEYDIRDRLGVVVRRVSLGEAHRAFYELIVRRYLHNDNAITRYLDNQVAEPKRLLRIPGFRHEVSGQPAQLLDTDLRPIDLDPSIMDRAVLTQDALTDVWSHIYTLDTPRTGRKIIASINPQKSSKWNCLPEWVRSLIDYLRETGELCHYGRLAVASWMVKCGFTDDEIHNVFKHAHNYNASRTQAKLNGIRKHVDEGKPIVGCRTVAESCKGHKAPDINCGALRISKARLESESAVNNPKPEEKPEPKPETKPVESKSLGTGIEEKRETAPREEAETKAGEEPRQVRHRENVQIPDALIEGVAGELMESAAVVRELVNWVVGYLDSLPCCQAIDIGKLLDGLLESVSEDTVFALYTLGIEYRGKDTDFPNYSALWDVYITILKYLDQAGIVEVRDDGATIVITKGGMCKCGDTENQVEVVRYA